MTELERVQYVTAHYYNMQGLRVVPIGVAILLLSAFRTWLPQTTWDGRLPLVYEGAIWIAGLTGSHVVGALYHRGYGYVEPRVEIGRRSIESLMFVLGLLTFALHEAIRPAVSLPAMFLGVAAVWRGLESRGLRPHYLPLGAGCIVYAVLPLVGLASHSRDAWIPLLAVAVMIAGIGDHLVLRRIVRPEQMAAVEGVTREPIAPGLHR